MSFLAHNKPNIEVGDTAIVFINVKCMYLTVIKPGTVIQVKYGVIRHSDLIGTPYGQRLQLARGFVHVLRPTPELWTLNLPHRTQILYFNDISMITAHLELRPGECMLRAIRSISEQQSQIHAGLTCVEAGTGSGSLTHALARTLAPHGRVYTFDFHEKRVQDARIEFAAHGLNKVVTAAQRDVCGQGFPDELNGAVDAVFLDLPHPWEAIEAAKKVLKRNGRLCCFSPCIEQVQKTCDAMRQQRFIDLTTIETLQKQFEARAMSLPVPDFSKKTNVWVERPDKRRKLETPAEAANETPMETTSTGNGDAENVNPDVSGTLQNEAPTKAGDNEKTWIAATPIIDIAGHTGFLTFATSFH